jgi:3-deoxy-manno-octulosonate cytidylyltransferase (CMP-KDO synthetase)
MPEPLAIGVIPARYGSTRFPAKILHPLAGRPLIQWVVERALQARRLSAVLVATDDERIARAVEGTGATAVMTRADHPSGTDRIAEAVAGRSEPVIINVQGDEPFMDPALIDRLADVMAADPTLDMATAAVLIERVEELRDPSVVKVVTRHDGTALYFSRAPHSALP